MFFILIVLIIIAISLFVNSQKLDLQIIRAQSFFSEFNIEGEKVYIKCELLVKNISSEDKSFILNAILKKDAETGLLKDKNLQGYGTDLSNNYFSINSKSELRILVIFVGDYAGTDRKHDRKLPEIIITEVKK